MKQFNLNDLFVYDLANNHQGDYEHAANIIREVGRVNAAAGVRGALKFQFRQLDSFIHPDYQARMDLKYVKRFKETRMSFEDFANLAKLARDNGLLTMCTPFDEASIQPILDLDIDIIKVASCSADDKPLLKGIAAARKPVVASTGGLRIDEIDWLVNFFEHERVNFALMHCISIYPTPDDRLQLNQVGALASRYPGVPIGWSTHEDQDNVDAIKIAYAKGARLFERHVGLNTDKYKLNNYSSTPAQLERWLAAYKATRAMLGAPERIPTSPDEAKSLQELKRGVFVKTAIRKGEALAQDKVFFAMPVQPGQLISGQWRSDLAADRDYAVNEAISDAYSAAEVSDDQIVYQIMLQVRGMLSKANVSINEDAAIEISHHYGLGRFREHGAVIITCINREYAKKLVIQLPRQKHPYHHHQKKTETFQLLDGDLEIVRDGERFKLEPGDIFHIEPNRWHKFHTLDGAIVEEVSTTHYNNDSFYEDPAIAKLPREVRKTQVDGWLEYFRAKHAV
jgi:sialic acid synthase SpsE/mannose-6-phosphate isomerase-like protein (cupin superfamily)